MITIKENIILDFCYIKKSLNNFLLKESIKVDKILFIDKVIK